MSSSLTRPSSSATPVQRRRKAVRIAFGATFLLSLCKIIAAYVTGSVSVLAEAIHSLLDLVSSGLAQLTVLKAIEPADPEHPFGHGKLETLSALFEGILLIFAGIYIVYEGIHHLKTGIVLTSLPLALGVITFSIVVNFFVFLQNKRTGKEEQSIAIETNAYHFLTDMLTSLALLLGLIIVHFTGWTWVDPVAAVLVALYIFWVAFEQIRKCLSELADVALPASELKKVEAIIGRFREGFLDFHDLRTRRMGSHRHIEMHLSVCSEFKVKQAHNLCDEIEDALMTEFKGAHVSIHIEPCDHHEAACQVICKLKELSASGAQTK